MRMEARNMRKGMVMQAVENSAFLNRGSYPSRRVVHGHFPSPRPSPIARGEGEPSVMRRLFKGSRAVPGWGGFCKAELAGNRQLTRATVSCRELTGHLFYF